MTLTLKKKTCQLNSGEHIQYAYIIILGSAFFLLKNQQNKKKIREKNYKLFEQILRTQKKNDCCVLFESTDIDMCCISCKTFSNNNHYYYTWDQAYTFFQK